jgi:hypothetical protein
MVSAKDQLPSPGANISHIKVTILYFSHVYALPVIENTVQCACT